MINMQHSIWLFLLLILIINEGSSRRLIYENRPQAHPRVRISTGLVEGRLFRTDRGIEGYAFQGIPYAEPPLKNLRFAKPVSKRPWEGVLQCYEYKPACWQNVSDSGQYVETSLSEDCLYLNVFVGVQCMPNLEQSQSRKPCPVIYYIHGGGYEFDSPRMFEPKILMENFASNGVIFVTVSYRLNVFGFWTTGTDEAPGNWAMHDMINGAEWVQREIGHFGGDPNRVTVQGHSSSSMAISLLTMSPRTEGLFQQAVMMSGTSCHSGSMSDNIDDYREIAVRLGCATFENWSDLSKYPEIIDCMRSIDYVQLGNAFNEMRGNATSFGNSKRMTVPRTDGPLGLFPLPLQQMIANRRAVRTITGTTKNEAGRQRNTTFITATKQTVEQQCKTLVKQGEWKHQNRIADECIFKYANDIQNDSNISLGIYPYWDEKATLLYEDVEYFAPCHLEASTLAVKGSTVFLYSFDYEKTGLEELAPWHAMDMAYLIGLHLFLFDERDKQIQVRYLSLFVNFAKYGHPTPRPNIDNATWTPFAHPTAFNYFSMDLPTRMKPDYHREAVLFWNYKVPAIDDQLPMNLMELEEHVKDVGSLKSGTFTNEGSAGVSKTSAGVNKSSAESTAVDPKSDEGKTDAQGPAETGDIYLFFTLLFLGILSLTVFLTYRYRNPRDKPEHLELTPLLQR